MLNKELKNTFLLDIIQKETQWGEYTLINSKNIEELFNYTLSHLNLNKHIKQAECSLFLTNDSDIQTYNKKYRNKDKATNTLSFPLENINLAKPESIKTLDGYCNLGDIICSIDTLKFEAKEQKKNFYNHFYHLLLHSFLHLLGHSHELEKDRIHMESTEISILAKLGIKTPYE